jgi:type I restriction enzyme S subunit
MSDLSSVNWCEHKFGDLCQRIVNGGTPATDNPRFWGGPTPWVTGADFTANGIGEIRRFVSEAGIRASATSVVKAGNLLVVTRTGVGKLAIAPFDIAISQDVTGVYVDGTKAETAFVFYVLSRELDELRKLNQGTSINGIIRRDLESHVVRIPCSRSTQKKISAILTTIDTAIEQTEALIEKFQHIKAGLMHDLFTRGVLPSGQLRPPRDQAPELYQETAIGWIPREWQLIALGDLANIVSGVTLGAKAGPTDTIDAPYLRVANVQDGYLDLNEIKTVRISPKTLDQLRLEPGDVLMNEGGDFDKLGRGAVWNSEIENCVHQNHVFRVRCNTAKLSPHYLAFFSESAIGKRYFVMSSKQSTNLASINSKQLKAYPIGLPGIAEQAAIAQSVDHVKTVLDKLATEARNFQARKLGLMQDLLTGKVTVDSPDNVAAHA